MMLVLVLAFIVVGILVYRLWKPALSAPKREVKPNQANLYFFYTKWCGFSQKAMPEWTKLEEKLDTSSHFGRTQVNPVSVDCEADRTTCALYEINAYPTVLLETKTGIHEYSGRVTTAGLLSFLRQTLGEERDRL